MSKKTIHEISLQVLTMTEKAALVTEGLLDPNGAQINHWLPLSQIDGDLEEGKVCVILVPEWLAREKGLTID